MSNCRGNLIEHDAGREENSEDLDKAGLSVKERTQQFNRMASVEDELSPRPPKSSEKDRSKNWVSELKNLLFIMYYL